jgi:hypothetical protein
MAQSNNKLTQCHKDERNAKTHNGFKDDPTASICGIVLEFARRRYALQMLADT